MKIGRFRYQNTSFTGIIKAEKVGSLGDMPIENIIESRDISAFAISISQWFSIDQVTYLPLFRPGKIICLGLNYRSHAVEGNWHVPEEPIYFEKSSSCVIPNKSPILIPQGIGRVDPEVELALVIGKTCKKISRDNAISHIAGYTIVNDVTARAIQKLDQEKRYPWFRAKSMDTFCPVGPWLVTPDEINPEKGLDIQLRINGITKQTSNTNFMIFKIPDIIAAIAKYLTLYPGDIISTGTPEGISPINPGDTVECEIEKIGILSNPVLSNG
ncbi:MAG TPA: fumarylacetoacetate hydrolase family protein [bacterium]|nr:fumarylacetoacetate hydrolase family protein [bacterium]